MNFDDLDKKMRVYEQSIDQSILPDTFMVARLDGRSFSRLTKSIFPSSVKGVIMTGHSPA